jgi:hypothetical protein
VSIEVAATGTAELTVSGSDLATTLNQQPDDGFPPLFATAGMTGFVRS